jgi:hypothetical protein
MSDPVSIQAETWKGGFYELAIKLGKSHDDRLVAAHGSFWSDANVSVRWQRTLDGGLEMQSATEFAPQSPDHAGMYRGKAKLPSGNSCCCLTFDVRDETSGVDWVGLAFPLGALAECGEPVRAFPFDEDDQEARKSRIWRRPLDQWLADVGARVFASVPYEYGLIGWEVSGQELPPRPAALSERYVGYLLPDTEGLLTYLPPTQYGGYHLS